MLMNRVCSRSRSTLTPGWLFMKSQTSKLARTGKSLALAAGVVCLVLVLILMVPPAAFAQGSDTGSVRGAVMDEQGRPVVNADVTIANAETTYSRSVKTDE